MDLESFIDCKLIFVHIHILDLTVSDLFISFSDVLPF